MADGLIVIERGDWRLAFAPDVGGAVASLTWRGREVLRPLPAGSTEVLEAASFPLVPFANRIADARFSFRGREIVLPVMPRFAPNTLHGDGWLNPWTVEQGNAALTLIYRHEAGAWPWAYEARQTVDFVEDRVRLGLSMTNVGDQDMPAGLGLHPYFPVTPQTRLVLDAPQVWALAEREVPTALFPAAEVFGWAEGPRVLDAPFVDHCYAGWGGTARLVEADRTITITASPGAAWVHVYFPGEGYCCIEPVTHRPDAVHAPPEEDSGLVALAPGETMSMWMDVAVSET